ncbi:MCE family protein [Nocardia callitridis]|uniref:MlaD family protein n=1 Tax=Nocardia callitridis TaxID=648753 RepID=A0ABP9KDI4_9NOCA
MTSSRTHSPRAILEPPARLVVTGVAVLRARRMLVSTIGLLMVLLLGGGYMVLGALKLDPIHSRYRVRVELAESGGILPGRDVTLHGVRVGRVAGVEVVDRTVVATAEIDDRVRIPSAGSVRVSALSAAGEQYLDFVPDTDGGPALTDGAVIPVERTSTPTTLSTMLGDLSGTLAQLDPEQIRAIERELGVSDLGPAELADLIDGGTFLLSTLDSVLPQTVGLLNNSKTVLTTLGRNRAGIQATAGDLSTIMGGVAPMTGGFSDVVARTPDTLAMMDKIIAENSPTLAQLLGNLATTSQMTYTHIPALQEFFFPRQRGGSTLDAITSAFHDGGVWALASIYPRYSCDYGVPRLPGVVADYPEPYLHARCTDPDPSVLPRGAANAPRPPGDNTAFAPPGVDPHATADPTPTGPFTIPTPYGGTEVPWYHPPK